MARMARQKMTQCPQTKVVLSGYSQGAEQVHGALKVLGRDAAKIGVSDVPGGFFQLFDKRTQAAVTFGDPMNMGIIKATGNLLGGWGALPRDRAKVFCYGVSFWRAQS
jgi:Cutinase